MIIKLSLRKRISLRVLEENRDCIRSVSAYISSTPYCTTHEPNFFDCFLHLVIYFNGSYRKQQLEKQSVLSGTEKLKRIPDHDMCIFFQVPTNLNGS